MSPTETVAAARLGTARTALLRARLDCERAQCPPALLTHLDNALGAIAWAQGYLRGAPAAPAGVTRRQQRDDASAVRHRSDAGSPDDPPPWE